MKYIIFNFVLLLSMSTYGVKNKNIVLEVKFDKNAKLHNYLIEKISDEKYVLYFTDQNKKPKRYDLSKDEYQNISYKANKIIWENLYRKPATVKKCLPYATIKNNFDSILVCQQNIQATANTFVLLSYLNKLYK